MTYSEVSALERKKAQLFVIEKVLDTLEEVKKDTKTEYKVVGKQEEQATNWRTGELLWEDEEKTIPKYADKYDYVPIPAEELTEERLARLSAIHDMKHLINSLI